MTVTLQRQPEQAAQQRYDLVIVGGGIYGACLLLEASRRGWKALLLERDDFGAATSLQSLRILHGGLRYLQTMDIARFRRSVREQAWWLANFPDLVEPLPCMMPLYNRGLHRTDVMRCALAMNDWLAAPLRRDLAEQPLQRSCVISAEQTQALFPGVVRNDLKGGAIWWDVVMKSPQRIMIELLRWSVAAGGQTLNYMECVGTQCEGDRIRAVEARCGLTQQTFSFATEFVANCAGPWLHDLNREMVQDGTVGGANAAIEEHARAFNLVIRRSPPSSHALAVSPDPGRSAALFVVPYGTMTMAGTCHLPPGPAKTPTQDEIARFLESLNQCLPGWNVSLEDVAQVLSGRLPPQSPGSHAPKKNPQIQTVRSGQRIWNMISVEGPKYTTARHNAQTALEQIAINMERPIGDYTEVPRPATRQPIAAKSDYSAQELHQWMVEESIFRKEDFLRRQDWLPEGYQQVCDTLAQHSDWPHSVA